MTQTDKTEVEISAKTIDEAIVAGCAELGIGMDRADFEIIDQGGLFRKMKVRVSIKTDPDEKPAAEPEEIQSAAASARGVKVPKKSAGAPSAEPSAQKTAGKSAGKTAAASKNNLAEPASAKPAAESAESLSGAERATHKVVKGNTDEFVIEGRERAPRKPREERPVTEFDPNAPKFVKSLEFAEKLFKLLDGGLTVTTAHTDREFIIEVHGENVSRLIGKEGHTMAAINTLVSSVAINHANGEGRRCVVDIENYREKRRQSLVELAKRKAEWVRESGRTVKLEPMPARERVIIHTALQDMEGIATHSVGDEPRRCLVIAPSAR